MGLLIKLQNGDTQMKSLKFGHDRPGGGDSGQPYIQNNLINEPNKLTLGDDDAILRGGIRAPINAIEDVARLTKFMVDLKSPKGLLFIAKQNILSRTAVKTEATKGLAYAGGVINEGIYTPLSTLAQAGVGFLGGHLNKQGIDPTGLIDSLSIKKYESVAYNNNKSDVNYQNNQQGSFNNRLLDLWWNKYNIKTDSPDILSYGGGPGSILGVGKTHIRFSTDGDGAPVRTGVNGDGMKSWPFTKPLLSYNLDSILIGKFNTRGSLSSLYSTLTGVSIDKLLGEDYYNRYNGSDSLPTDSYSVYTPFTKGTFPETTDAIGKGSWKQTDFIDVNPIQNGSGEILEDFRLKLDPTSAPQNTFLSVSKGYSLNNNVEVKYNLGNPGQKGDVSDFNKGKSINGNPSTALDKVNASYIYKSRTGNKLATDPDLTDIIPFYIAILNNDKQLGGDVYKKYMHFRTFIDSFSDSYDADWNSLSYMGRAEKFYKYGGFDRKISLAFTVVAQSKQEITAMYDKLNFLASSLAPEYLDTLSSGYMTGNIAYITLGDYIVDQPGIITSINFDIPEESPWDIGINPDGTQASKSDARQLPHMIRVTGFNFIPLSTFRPSKLVFKDDRENLKSVALLEMKNQRYIDQNRPNSTIYDAEGEIKPIYDDTQTDIPNQIPQS